MVRERFLQGPNEAGIKLQGGVISFPAEYLSDIVEALERHADQIRDQPGDELFAVEGLARKIRRA